MGLDELEELLADAHRLTRSPRSPQEPRVEQGSTTTESSVSQPEPANSGLFIAHKVCLLHGCKCGLAQPIPVPAFHPGPRSVPSQVSPKDTLAGLAIRYNVSVSEKQGGGWHCCCALPCCWGVHTAKKRGDRTCVPDLTSVLQQVADIKRANGLLSDSALYAMETIQIPTKLLPVG